MPDEQKEKYPKDRYNPTLANCHSLSMRFDGSTLDVLSSGILLRTYYAVSGKPNADGSFDYSVARQKLAYKGPIPAGTYWIRPDELWTNAWYKNGPWGSWGNYRIVIHAFTTTQTYGRSGMFIHGGSNPGSAGCIDLTSGIDAFVQDLQRDLGNMTTCQIRLEVVYPASQ